MSLNKTILEVTQADPKVKYAIDSELGRAYSLFQKLRFGQIGSQGYQVIEYSTNFASFFEHNEDTNKANIELRPLGIIVGFQQGYRSYNWIINFESLILTYHKDIVNIQSPDSFLKVQPLHRDKIDTKFIDKVNRQKGLNARSA